MSVVDNASIHKRNDMRKTIRQRGIILEYLPYRPDFNSIEYNQRNTMCHNIAYDLSLKI